MSNRGTFLVVNNFFTGFTVDANSGYYLAPRPYYPDCDFMVDFIPFGDYCKGGGPVERSLPENSTENHY